MLRVSPGLTELLLVLAQARTSCQSQAWAATAASAQHLPSPGQGGSPNTAPGTAERGIPGDAEPPRHRETLVCPKKRLFQTLLELGESLLWLF